VRPYSGPSLGISVPYHCTIMLFPSFVRKCT